MQKTKFFSAITSLLFLYQPAFASHPAGSTFLSLGDGYYFFAAKREIKNTQAPVVRLGYNFSDQWGAQIGASLLNSKTKGNEPKNTVHGWDYALDAIYHMQTYHQFEPYLLAGLGVLSLKPNGTDPTDQAHIQVGLGAHYFISPTIGLGLEGRDNYIFTGGKNDLQLTANIQFIFGGSSSVSESVHWKGEG